MSQIYMHIYILNFVSYVLPLIILYINNPFQIMNIISTYIYIPFHYITHSLVKIWNSGGMCGFIELKYPYIFTYKDKWHRILELQTKGSSDTQYLQVTCC